MSELTPCNYCNLQAYKRRAKERGQKVTVLNNRQHGGKDVYMHPDFVKVDQNSKELYEEYRIAWFMELPNSCFC